MKILINEIVSRGLKRIDTRELSKKIKGKKIARPLYFVYNYYPQDKKYKLRIEFKKENVTKEEIVDILEKIINKLKYSQ